MKRTTLSLALSAVLLSCDGNKETPDTDTDTDTDADTDADTDTDTDTDDTDTDTDDTDGDECDFLPGSDFATAMTHSYACASAWLTKSNDDWTQVLTVNANGLAISEASSLTLDLAGANQGAVLLTVGENLDDQYWECYESADDDSTIIGTVSATAGTVTLTVTKVKGEDVDTEYWMDVSFTDVVLEGGTNCTLSMDNLLLQGVHGWLYWS